MGIKIPRVLLLCAFAALGVEGFSVAPSTVTSSRRALRLGPAAAPSVGATSLPLIGGRSAEKRSLRLRGHAAATMQLGDKDKGKGGTSLLEKPITTPSPTGEGQVDPKKPYHVLLFNDVSPSTPSLPLSPRHTGKPGLHIQGRN